ncbi:MAG: hypothetical protein IJW79_04460 [Clostridia bacterium]|nr:hypothetical protein [Clostridia bacterium]
MPEEWGRLESATTSDSNLTLSIQDGALRIHDIKASRLVICNERELSGNYVFEAELCAEELANATRYMGIVFGAQDDGSLIAVDMRMSDGRILFESFDPATNKWTSLTTQAKHSTTPALRTFYKFKIECVNGYAVFYADGVKYARFEIPEKFLSGKVGIILSQCAVHVDNVRIFEVGEHAVPDSAPEPIYEYIEVPTYTESFDGLTAVPTGWDKMTTATTTPANLTVSAENDALVISDMKSAIAAVSLDQTFSGNYTVEADIALTSRANDTRYMGVLIGVQEDDSFAGCQMRLSDGRFELTKWDSTSKWANIGETVYLKDKLTLELGTAYHFKLVCTDGYATAYVNDINCGGFTIPEKHLSGKIGFITSQATVSVDNISVKTITKYEATPIYEENFEYVHSVPEEWSDTATSSPLKMSADGEKLILKNTTGRSIVALSEELDGNFMYEAELTLTQKHTSDSWWLGPVFGLQEDGTYVLFDANIVSRKWSATPWNGKSWDAALAKPATADEYVNNIGVNIPQKFKLICLDGTGTIIINGVKICSFEIPEKFLSGKVGIGFRNSTVEVDNVRICKLAVGTDYTTLYDHSFNGLTSLPAEWSKNTAATLSNSTLEISTDKEGLILKDAKGQRTVVALDKTLDGGDFIYELDLTMTERHDTDVTGTSWWMGPAFGIHDDGSFAIMDVKILNGQWYVEPWLGTKWGTAFVKASTSADYISTFRLGVLQHFKLVCVDGIATASINGVEICTFELPEEYRTGKVGVGFRNSTVVVDNVKLQKLDKDEKGLNISAQTLTDATLSLGENHVMHNKTLSVKFDLSELADGQAVTVGHGDSAVKITNTTVTSYNGNTSVYNAEHGLDVSGNIEVIIDSDYGTATARIKRSDNTAFVTPSFAWSGRDGEIFAKSEGVTLENVKMNWNSTEHGNNVWIVGDSCLDINSDTSFAYYLGKGGLSLIGSCDETSTTAVTEFENALKHGAPEYAVWVMGMNEADGDNAVNAAWKTAVDEFLALCEDNGVTPVLCTMPGTNHSFKNSVVTDSGYRYIDLAKADGAEAMYKEILMDFTEIKESMGGTRIRVATFNTGNFTGAGLTMGAEKTVAAYRELFESVNADLWGLQEDEQFVDNAYPATEGTTPYDAIYKNILPHHKGFFTGKYNGKAFLTKFNLYDVEQVYYPAPDTSYTSSVYHYGHRWFLTGKIEVDGKEVSLVSLHFDWNCKERRATQIQEVIKFAKEQEYCIIMGDFNPEDYLNGVEISKNLFYEEELALFREIGMTHANAGEFGLFDTLVEPTQPELYGPWDNIIVSSNIRLLSAEKVYVDWMIDHAVVVAEMELN